MGREAELLPGTLDLLVLKAVSLGRLHGYGVLVRIAQMTDGALQVQQGAGNRLADAVGLALRLTPRELVG